MKKNKPNIPTPPVNKAQTSILGNIWQKKEFCPNFKQEIIKHSQVSDIIAQILATKFDDLSQIDNFLSATLKHNMSDPFILKDMKKGVDLVINAIKNQQKITIFADYDVDGATSAALFKNYLRQINIDVSIYVPDRILEGYGPNVEALLNLKKQGTDLVITVDSGTTSFEPLEAAKKAGLDVIVIDHHLGTASHPEALAIINPNRLDESDIYSYLCAAGVSFLFLVALNKTLKEQNLLPNNEPNLLNLLDLVALGTVCDVVPLKGLNRAFVKQGLKIMKKNQRPGIQAIAEIANCDITNADSYHLGFVIGPRINAGGRVAISNLGAELLSSVDYDDAYQIALKLEIHNKERKAVEQQVLEDAIAKIAQEDITDKSVIIVAGENWHQGVIGIVASRIKEKYNLPTIIISLDNNIGKASCRSIKGVNLGKTIVAAKEEGLLVNGGGHAMAAGFTINAEKLKIFSDYMNQALSESVALAASDNVKLYDYNIPISALNHDFLNNLQLLAPYGQENHEPKFMINNCCIMHIKQIGVNHLKLHVAEVASGVYGQRLEVLAWKSLDTTLGQNLMQAKAQNKKITVFGIIKVNKWQKNVTIQFYIEDFFICSS